MSDAARPAAGPAEASSTTSFNLDDAFLPLHELSRMSDDARCDRVQLYKDWSWNPLDSPFLVPSPSSTTLLLPNFAIFFPERHKQHQTAGDFVQHNLLAQTRRCQQAHRTFVEIKEEAEPGGNLLCSHSTPPSGRSKHEIGPKHCCLPFPTPIPFVFVMPFALPRKSTLYSP